MSAMGGKRTWHLPSQKSFLHRPFCALSLRMQRPCFRFTPVLLKARHDGWTPERQRRFIEELAAKKSIARACRAVGMSRMSAYKLRDHPGAGEFRSAWRRALEPGFVAERPKSPRSLRRLRILEKSRKVDELHEMHGPPVSPAPAPSNLSTLETLLDRLRAQDLQPPFTGA